MLQRSCQRFAFVPMIVAVLILSLGLAACGDDGDDTTPQVVEESDADTTAEETPLYQRTPGPPGPDAPPPVDVQPTVLDSGLQIIDITVGEGAVAEAGSRLVVHYTGWLEDGTKFDSSLDVGQPFRFVLGRGQVIQGWEEGIAGMKVGGNRRLIIPPELAYGERGAGTAIPPNAQLTFDVELLSVE